MEPYDSCPICKGEFNTGEGNMNAYRLGQFLREWIWPAVAFLSFGFGLLVGAVI